MEPRRLKGNRELGGSTGVLPKKCGYASFIRVSTRAQIGVVVITA